MSRFKRSRAAAAVSSGAIDDLFATLAHRADVISFAVGAPDPELLDHDLVADLAREAAAEYGSEILQYGMTRGFAPLLEQARIMLAGRGIHCDEGKLHITTGGSGALHTVCMAVLDPGDVVLVETPSYGPALKVFRSHGGTTVGVASDEFGMLPDALDTALAQHPVAFVYLLPTFQNPTGRTMSAQRRTDIAEVIRRHDALVLEDDVYGELRYRGEPVPAFWSFAPECTVYLTSLSKTLAPALRVGIALLPGELLADVLALKQGIDMQTSSYSQAIAARFLAGPAAAGHVDRVVRTYRTKLDRTDEALREYLPPGFHWVKPEGGMFVWLAGPPGFAADAVLEQAVARSVAYLPGRFCYSDDGAAQRNTIRLSIANVPLARIDTGIRRLGALLREVG